MAGAFVQPAQAAPPAARPAVVPAVNRPAYQPYAYPQYNGGSRPIGWDWWRTYPYSPYNTWRNAYYLPYNANYLYAPGQAYPYYPLPPVPLVPSVPLPWGAGSMNP